jgi:hypothetical protein
VGGMSDLIPALASSMLVNLIIRPMMWEVRL